MSAPAANALGEPSANHLDLIATAIVERSEPPPPTSAAFDMASAQEVMRRGALLVPDGSTAQPLIGAWEKDVGQIALDYSSAVNARSASLASPRLSSDRLSGSAQYVCLYGCNQEYQALLEGTPAADKQMIRNQRRIMHTRARKRGEQARKKVSGAATVGVIGALATDLRAAWAEVAKLKAQLDAVTQ